MTKAENLRGQQFGDILVLELDTDEERLSQIQAKRGKHTILWKCQCVKCKNISYKTKTDLKAITKRNASGCNNCFGDCIAGNKYGRLTVLNNTKKTKKKDILWECMCDCGNKVWLSKGVLKSGNTRSCGCLFKGVTAERNRNNGVLGGDSSNEYAKLYNSWVGMKNRCDSPKNNHYKDYGGRGISVCKEWYDWLTFKEWALNNGWKDGLTIDRVDVNGNYEPSNCRWVTMDVQANNKRNNKMITYQGKTQSLADWCRELNLEYFKIKARFNYCHMTPEEAFTEGYYKRNGKRELVEDRESYKYR